MDLFTIFESIGASIGDVFGGNSDLPAYTGTTPLGPALPPYTGTEPMGPANPGQQPQQASYLVPVALIIGGVFVAKELGWLG